MKPVTTFGKLLITILVTSILIMPLAKVVEAQSAAYYGVRLMLVT